MRVAAAVQIAALGAMWGSAFVFIKLALDDLRPLEVAAGRLLVGAVLLHAVLLLRGGSEPRMPRGRRAWVHIAVLALMTNLLPFTLIAWGVERLPTSAAAITNATTPLFTACLAIGLGLEMRPRLARWAGIVIGFAGVVVMFGLGFSGGSPAAIAALLGAALAYAAGFVLARSARIAGSVPLVVAAAQLSLAALLMLPAAAFALGGGVSGKGLLALIALGVLSTALPTILYFHVVRVHGSTSSSLATYVVPPVGVLLGWLFLDERIGVSALLGGALIVAGIALAENAKRPARLRRELA